MTEHFCTYFDQNYLVRAVALYESMCAHFRKPVVLWALCMDDAAYDALEALDEPNFRPVRLEKLEAADPELAAAKKNRSQYERYFTCTPAWTLYLLESVADSGRITYLDADMLFFEDVQPVFDELGDGSILIIPHRFSENVRDREVYGNYNVGLLTFRADDAGRACLKWWRERCIEWCYDRLEEDRFADQKYMDRWPELFSNVIVLQHIGVNTAPWNFSNYEFTRRGDRIYVDEQPLILYHYQGLKLINGWLCDPGVHQYAEMPPATLEMIYSPYLNALRKGWQRLRINVKVSSPGFDGFSSRKYGRQMFLRQLLKRRIILVFPPFSWRLVVYPSLITMGNVLKSIPDHQTSSWTVTAESVAMRYVAFL